MKTMYKIWPKEKKNEEGYKAVWNTLCSSKALKSDWFIKVEWVREDWENGDFLEVSGMSPDKRWWAIEFEPWKHWLGMNIYQETLDNLDKNTILAAILYEMTFNGFTEDKVQGAIEKLNKSFEEIYG